MSQEENKQRIDQVSVDSRLRMEGGTTIWKISVPDVNGMWWLYDEDTHGGLEVPANTLVEVVKEYTLDSIYVSNDILGVGAETANQRNIEDPEEYRIVPYPMSDEQVKELEKKFNDVGRNPMKMGTLTPGGSNSIQIPATETGSYVVAKPSNTKPAETQYSGSTNTAISSYPKPNEWSVEKGNNNKNQNNMYIREDLVIPKGPSIPETPIKILENIIKSQSDDKNQKIKELEAKILDWYVKTKDEKYASHMNIKGIQDGKDVG